jgi:hypothetical protein
MVDQGLSSFFCIKLAIGYFHVFPCFFDTAFQDEAVSRCINWGPLILPPGGFLMITVPAGVQDKDIQASKASRWTQASDVDLEKRCEDLRQKGAFHPPNADQKRQRMICCHP